MTTDNDFFQDDSPVISPNVFNTTGITSKDLTSRGGVEAPGRFHFLVNSWSNKVEEGKVPHCLFNCVVLPAEYASDQQNAQVDKTLFHRLYYAYSVKDSDGKPTGEILPVAKGSAQMRSIMTWALGLGLITTADLDIENTNIDWNNAVGRQFCAEVKATKSEYNGETRIKHEIPFSRIFPVTDPYVEDWPKNAEYLAMAVGASDLDSQLDDVANDSGVDDLDDI